MSKMVLCCAAMIAALSACGGSSGGGGGNIGGGVSAPTMLSPAPAGSFNALVNRETKMINRFYNSDLSPRTTAQMPTTGSVRYTGMAAFPTNGRATSAQTTNGQTSISRPQPDMAARAVMNADFGSGSISGTIDQFHAKANPTTTLPGSLTLGNAAINGTSIGTGTVTGTFPVNGTAQNVQNLGYSGQFVGENASGVTGTIGFLAPQASGGTASVQGSFIAAKVAP